MFSKHKPPEVHEYLNRWSIPTWDALTKFHVLSVEDLFFWVESEIDGIKRKSQIWFQDESYVDKRHLNTVRWKKILRKACMTSSLITIIGDLLQCEISCSAVPPQDPTYQQFRLRNPNAILISGQRSMSGDNLKIFEFCCGGFKGWSRAADYLNENEQIPYQCVGGVDNDPTCIDMCIRHSNLTWKPCKRNTSTHLSPFGVEPKSALPNGEDVSDWFVGDVGKMTVWEDISLRSPDVACISAPCQSFTTTGNRQGWNHELGTVLANSISCAAVAGIPILAIENSSQLVQNNDFHGFLCLLLEYWGYQVVAEDVVSLEKMHPAVRNRAIIIAVCKDKFANLDQEGKPLKLDHFIPPQLGGVMSDRLGPLPEILMMNLDLEEKDFQMMNNLEYMPKFMRARPRNPPIRRRLITPANQKLSSGTSMAKYGDQQNLPPHCLKNGGILGELMKDLHHHDIRFVAPIEILLCLGCSQAVILPKNQRLGWHIIGNAIHEYHALVGLITVWNFLRFHLQTPQLDFLEALVRHQSKCWVARQVDFYPDPTCPDVMLVHGEKTELTLEYSATSLQADEELNEPPNKRLRRDPVGVCTNDADPQNVNVPEAGPGPHPDKRNVCMSIAQEQDDGKISVSHGRKDPPFLDILWDARRKGAQAEVAPTCLEPEDDEEVPVIPPDGRTDSPDAEFEYVSHQYALVSRVPNNAFEGEGEIPNGQSLQDKYLIAVQMTNKDDGRHDLEVFWATPDQTIEDWVLGRVVLEGTKLVLDPPHVGGINLPFESKLHQIGDIIHCRYTITPRTPNTPEMLTYFQEGEPVATVLPYPGMRVFEVFPSHHWTGQYFTHDGFVIPPDRPVFTEQAIHLDDPLDIRKSVYEDPIELITPTASVDDDDTDDATKLEWNVTKNRIDQLLVDGGVGDDEMAMYLCTFTNQCRPQHVVLPFMHVEELFPYDGHFVIPFIWDTHWGILTTDTNSDGLREFVVITDLRTIFDEVKHRICAVEPMANVRQTWHFSICMTKGWCGYEALYSLVKLWNIDVNRLPSFNQARVEGILCMFGHHRTITDSLIDCGDAAIENMAWHLRHLFVQEIHESPSTPSVVGYGFEETHPMFAQISSAMVSRGIDKQNAIQLTHKVLATDDPRIGQMKKAKPHKIVQLASQIAVQHDFQFPKMNKGQAVTRLQKFFREKRDRQLQLRKLSEEWLRTCSFPGNQFQVTNGHWLQIQPMLQTLVEGVSIATHQELKPIITTENALGPGAHAAIMMNQYPDLPAPYSQKAEVIEVIDPMGNHALIKIWLIQLGVKPVIRCDPHDGQVTTDATVSIQIKVYSELVDPKTWNDVLSSPVKTILKLLWSETKVNVADIWSRRFFLLKHPQSPVEPVNADVFSVYARIESAELDAWLTKSGATSQAVFINEVERRTLRILWTGRDIRSAHVGLNQLHEAGIPHLGLVVNRNLDSFGIRFLDADFPKAWVKIKGDQIEPPKSIAETGRFWIENFPVEFNHKHVEEWSSKVGWEIRPLKKIRQKWLVASAAPPKPNLTANKVPLLVYPVSKYEVADSKVMAGRIFTPKPQKPLVEGPRRRNPKGDDPTPDVPSPDLLHDAWQTYRDRKGMKDNRIPPPSRAVPANSAPSVPIKDEDARNRIARCEEQIKSLTGKVSNIETEVTGLKSSFQDTLKTSLESNSRSLMSQFKDLITDMKTPSYSRAKERDRGGSIRSRSPKTQDQDEKQD